MRYRLTCPACHHKAFSRTKSHRCRKCHTMLLYCNEAFNHPKGDRVFMWISNQCPLHGWEGFWLEIPFPTLQELRAALPLKDFE